MGKNVQYILYVKGVARFPQREAAPFEKIPKKTPIDFSLEKKTLHEVFLNFTIFRILTHYAISIANDEKNSRI